MLVYKVVNRVEDRLVSAVLPKQLAETYMDSKGRVRTVEHAMAFDNLDDARFWRNHWHNHWSNSIATLEIWEAEAESTKRPHPLVSFFKYKGEEIYLADATNLPRKDWKELVAKAMRKRKERLFRTDAVRVTFFANRILGSVLCHNLKLKRRVE